MNTSIYYRSWCCKKCIIFKVDFYQGLKAPFGAPLQIHCILSMLIRSVAMQTHAHSRHLFPRHEFTFCYSVVRHRRAHWKCIQRFRGKLYYCAIRCFSMHWKWQRATILMVNGLGNFIMTIKRFTLILKQKVCCNVAAIFLLTFFLPLQDNNLLPRFCFPS